MQFRNLAEDAQIEIHFETFGQDKELIAPSSAFTASDFVIYKNGSAVQKTTTNGITVTSPFDGVDGTHLIIADTSNDTGDAGFWEIGGRYQVKFNTAKTVDGKSIDGRCVPRGAFGIESEYMRGTNAAALASGVTVTAIGANVITAASIAADAGTEIGAAVLTALGTGTWATAITQRTDNLPSDPADQSAVEAAITAAITLIKGADNDTLKTLSDQIDGIDAGGGLTEEQADTLDAIYDFTSGISGDQIQVVGPVSSGGAIQLILGKDYKVASESELTIAVTDTGGALHADLTSATLAATKAFGASRENGEAVIAGTIYSTTYATNVLTIKVEIDADQLPDTLPLADDWAYQIHRVTSTGDEVVVLSGQLTTTMRTV